jgi:hypothetical protein
MRLENVHLLSPFNFFAGQPAGLLARWRVEATLGGDHLGLPYVLSAIELSQRCIYYVEYNIP